MSLSEKIAGRICSRHENTSRPCALCRILSDEIHEAYRSEIERAGLSPKTIGFGDILSFRTGKEAQLAHILKIFEEDK